MTRTALLFGLAILAEAGIAALVSPDLAAMLRIVVFGILGIIAALGLSAWPPFQSALALSACLVIVALWRMVNFEAAIEPLALAGASLAALAGAALGHFVPRAVAFLKRRFRGHRAAERFAGQGLMVRIGGQAFSVSDWSLFGLFIEAPKGRFNPRQEVIVELDGGDRIDAEVVRVAGAGVGLRFTKLSDAERMALSQRLISNSLAA